MCSDCPNEQFFKSREEFEREKYPVIDLYFNRENMKKGVNQNFIRINFVVKSLLNELSNKINKKSAKKLTLENSYVYKENQKISDDFIFN